MVLTNTGTTGKVNLSTMTHLTLQLPSNFYTVFFRASHKSRRINVFYYFQGQFLSFKGNFTKFQDNSRTNGTIFKFQEFSRTKVKFNDFSKSVRTLNKTSSAVLHTFKPRVTSPPGIPMEPLPIISIPGVPSLHGLPVRSVWAPIGASLPRGRSVSAIAWSVLIPRGRSLEMWVPLVTVPFSSPVKYHKTCK